MKQLTLSFIATSIAIGLSVYSSADAPKRSGELYEKNGELFLVPAGIDVPGLCPAAEVRQCKIEIDGFDRWIYHGNGQAYLRN